MHEHSFPESSESPERRSDRAVEALQYEEKAGLGFRRRTHGVGNPYADPERYEVGGQHTAGETFAGMLAGLGTAFGGLALVVRPLLFGLIAAILLTLGSAGGGQATRIARIGFVVAGICFFVGMLAAIWLDRPVAY